MKKVLSMATISLFCASIFAQEQTEKIRKNDILLSPIELGVTQDFNMSYERIINKNSGIGINALIRLNDGNDIGGLRQQYSPFYRRYFGEKFASGFFIEGFVPIRIDKNQIFNYTYFPEGGFTSTYRNEMKTNVGVGVGLGGKWVLKNNLVLEASAGVAKMLSNESYSQFSGKAMLGIGYRF